jgi:hypothetical protein
MKKSVLLFGLTSILFVLAACKITSASPDTSTLISMKTDENIVLKVEGPVDAAGTRYVWTYNHSISELGRGKEFSFSPGQLKYIYNKMNIKCSLEEIGWVWSCGADFNCGYRKLDWVEKDYRSWNIRVIQEPPLWEGNYIINGSSDLEYLKGFTNVTGDLIIGNGVTELDSLPALESIGGSLVVYDTDLSTLDGLNNLKYIGGSMRVTANPELCNYIVYELVQKIMASGGIKGIIDIHNNKDCSK